MVLNVFRIINSLSPFAKPLGFVLEAPTTIGTTITLLFYRFFYLSDKI